MVGDNLETDIKLGADGGVETIFVTSGVHTRDDVEKLQIYPDHTVSALSELIEK